MDAACRLWTLYFAGVMAFRLHPKNFPLPDRGHLYDAELEFAARVADDMLQMTMLRFPPQE